MSAFFVTYLTDGVMMFIFKPTYVFDKAVDITPQFLHKKQIHALLLDLDNTLTTHNNPIVPDSSKEWVESMKAAGVELIIVSNNHGPRVEPFAAQLGLEYVCEGAKPLTLGYSRALKRLGIENRHAAAVGDQIFTDILGSNLKGIRSIFVFPIKAEESLPFRFKRALEKPFLPDKSRIISKPERSE